MDYRAVFDGAPDVYLLLAPDPPRFTMLAANEARLRATGTRREDVIGRPLFEVFPDNPEELGATGVRNLRASLHEVLRTRQPHRMALQKYDIRGPGGAFEERYWEPLNAPVFDASGALVSIIHRVEDVTDQVLAHRRLRTLESVAAEASRRLTRETEARVSVEAILARLRESEARYRLLADMIPQNIWTTDATGHHTYFSRRWYAFTGATPEESHGEAWTRYIHPDDRDRMHARWKHSLQTGEPYEIEYRFRGADGAYHWFLGKAMPLRDDAGEIVEWFGTATDITERKQLDEERERLLASERAARAQVTTILESITDAFYALDREWRFTHVNREAERLLKRPREELLGRVMWEEFPDAVGSAFHREYHRAAAERTTVDFEAYAPTIGLWVNARAYPSDDGLSVFFRDVTARRVAEERLRESERSFRALANSIPQLAWMADAAGWIFWYNERWHEYTGTTLAEMEGWGWQKVHHPAHVAGVVERIRHAFESGTPWEDTFPLRSRTGEYRWFLSRAVPIRDSGGRVLRWFGTNTDITAEIEARAEAVRRREELERVTESRTRLMRGFSHDVKNPLGAADGHAQLLEEGILGELTEKQRASVRRIRRSIHTSLRLIHDLLELAQAEAGQLEVECVTTDVSAAAREVVEDFRGQATGVGLAVECQLPDGVLADTDPTRLRQILANLLSNAVKYAPTGTVTVETTLRPSGGPRPGPWVAASVRDTGPGIPIEKQASIFQEFTRLDPTAQPGAGIGLAISRRIAQLLGGDLTVESAAGRGATFTLWLPPATAEGDATKSG
ncbi:PAS domain-containing sensor histidine kinase [Roseisolibacter agri]|uniref:PAS domain-containing sensor histidine kinase n=1 Tax=Roseisolibacter agri TaxID=2014610 RepID=UPI0024E12386|nr:PAS domain S-box protein [Roseisolibacter agri]